MPQQTDIHRPAWDDYFMQIARDVATRATCLRRAVGAVIVRDRRILTTGYNGAPMGQEHCLDVGCHLVGGHCIRCLHAEQNAIIQAAYFGVSTAGGTLYCTHQPCNMCAKMIVNAGIRKVVIGGSYPDEFALEVLSAGAVELTYMPAPAAVDAADSDAARADAMAAVTNPSDAETAASS
jgi:dCMP deaminase